MTAAQNPTRSTVLTRNPLRNTGGKGTLWEARHPFNLSVPDSRLTSSSGTNRENAPEIVCFCRNGDAYARAGIILGAPWRMMNPQRPRKPQSLLRWIFQRGNDLIVCQVDAERSLIVSLIPHGGITRTLIEKFDNGLQAFQRHAQIVSNLRDFGWTVASYGR
jgi:hypothetical protein